MWKDIQTIMMEIISAVLLADPKFTHLFYADILKHICILTSLSIRL